MIISKDELYHRLKLTLEKRNDIWRKFIDDLGGIHEATSYFYKQQELMLEYSELISNYVKTKIIDTSNANIKSLTKYICTDTHIQQKKI